LVRGGDHLKLAIAAQHEPGPAGAKAFRARVVESSLKGIKRTKGGVDCTRQFSGRCAATIGLHNPPEHAMVGMTATIVTYRRADILRNLVNATHQILNRQGSQF